MVIDHPHEKEDRPWEQAGAIRRDCEPHRGEFLSFLGGVSAVCGLVSLCLVFPALLGLPLGLAAWAISLRDLTACPAFLPAIS
jgi:hypothetical protein